MEMLSQTGFINTLLILYIRDNLCQIVLVIFTTLELIILRFVICLISSSIAHSRGLSCPSLGLPYLLAERIS